LYEYHSAINTADYDGAMGLLTPDFAAEIFPDERQWHGAYETTYDDQLEVVEATRDGDQARVRLRFRSQQESGYGPKGARRATCLWWDIDYRVELHDGEWLIDGASGHRDPAWTRC
ncbi:MAG TPA: hypothetical protein VK103_00900, partial [Bacillota bacterium]|nr:hypothetical protein [Bacillota bacterium]